MNNDERNVVHTNGSGLRVCGAMDQCSVWGPKALRNIVNCGFVLEALLFIRASENKEWKTQWTDFIHIRYLRVYPSRRI
jgi:hypothetical protein